MFRGKFVVPIVGMFLLGLLLIGCSGPTSPATTSSVGGEVVPATPTTEATLVPAATAEPVVEAAASEVPQPTATAETRDATVIAEEMDKYLTSLSDQELFAGAVLVAQAGEVLFTKGYGMADAEQEVPNTPQTLFRIGSITKSFTAMAIMQLQEAGKLHVNDFVCDYLPDCPAEWEPITIHQILTHTSGLGEDRTGYSAASAGATPTSPAEMLERLRNQPLLSPPGESFYYSNSGYNTLGYLIEQLSGQTYADYLQTNIFDPLGMASSGYANSPDGLAIGYVNQFQKAQLIDLSVPYAAGALHSTVEDLYRWDRALYSTQLVSEEALAAITTPYVPITRFEDFSYGYGWTIGEIHERFAVEHAGGLEGFRADLMRFPEEQVTVVVLSNRENVDPYLIATVLAKLVFGE